MSLKRAINRRIYPDIQNNPWPVQAGGRLDFHLGIKRAKFPTVEIQEILEAIRPALAYLLGYDSNMDMHEFLQSQNGQLLVRQMAEEFVSPGTYRNIKCDDDGRMLVRNAWSNSWNVKDITLTGSPAIDQIVDPSGNELQVIIQNYSTVNDCFIGWTGGSSVGYIKLLPNQIIQIPFAHMSMFAHGTAGQHIITQRGGY